MSKKPRGLPRAVVGEELEAPDSKRYTSELRKPVKTVSAAVWEC